ncbi:MAG: GNAT family N-acetyltransferase [Spirochaetes bacterium]|nr:GNAT family N-acetyltransferase [Spirochaetota bacterium]
MIFEKITSTDIQFIKEFQLEGWPEIIPVFKFYINKSFCYPIKVISENRIVGIGSGISFGNTAWLAHIIVKEEFRNNGIGAEIVKYLCNFLKQNGVVSISLISTDLGFPIYKKVGFVEQTEYAFYRNDGVLENKISKNISYFSNPDIDDIILLDKRIAGEDRSVLLKEKLSDSYVYKKNNKLSGFFLPELGEGLIVADDAEAGIELMKLRYTKVNRGALPINNSDGIQYLKNNGFKEVIRAKRMIYGETFIWESSKVFNRIAGNFG